jgi:hypothetical protein
MAKIRMGCDACGHRWTMSKIVWWFTPYAQRGVNGLFICKNCGSQGRKLKRKEK